MVNEVVSYDEIENCYHNAADLLNKFYKNLQEYEQRGSTSKLWIQYFRMVSIAKEYIRAERMDDWQVHLNSVKQILPYFHMHLDTIITLNPRIYISRI